MNEQEFRELSAARALHALSPEQEQAFSTALADHPEWQSVVDEDRETAADLGAATEEAAPPAAARAAILDLISRTPQFGAPERPAPPAPAGPEPEGSSSPSEPQPLEQAEPLEYAERAERAEAPVSRSYRRAGWFALAASAALVLGVALALPLRGILEPQDPVSVALQQVESARDARTATVALEGGGEATLHWSDSAQQAVLVAEGMQAAPADRDYELWIVRGDRPISLGVMRTGDDGGTAVLAQGFEPGDALAVTVEDRGGSPTGLPTTDPIAVIATASLRGARAPRGGLCLRSGGAAALAEAEQIDHVLDLGEAVLGAHLLRPLLDDGGRELPGVAAAAADEVVVMAGGDAGPEQVLTLGRLQRIGLTRLGEPGQSPVDRRQPDGRPALAQRLVQLLRAHESPVLGQCSPHRLTLPCVPLWLHHAPPASPILTPP
jgi:anti-sigma-K factor RskA